MMTATRPAKHDRKTERRFGRLPASYLVRHDLRVPAAPGAVVDHVVIGATGVFTVKSRHFDHAVFIRGADIRSDGHYLEDIVEHARGEASAVGHLLEVEVRPVVVVYGSRLTITGIFSTPVVRGVRFCEPGKLTGVLTTPPCLHTPEAVGHLAARLDG
jgi:hypothetical protein